MTPALSATPLALSRADFLSWYDSFVMSRTGWGTTPDIWSSVPEQEESSYAILRAQLETLFPVAEVTDTATSFFTTLPSYFSATSWSSTPSPLANAVLSTLVQVFATFVNPASSPVSGSSSTSSTN